MSQPQFHPLAVTALRRETRDSVVVTLQPSAGDAARFSFTQGQYLTLRATIGGEEVRRSYSICAMPGEPLRIGVKLAPHGLFSTHANRDLRVGDTLEAMPPQGKFHLPLDPANAKHYLGIAAGSGITPLVSLIRTTLAREPQSRFTLIYGNRASSAIMFRDELDDLKSLDLSRLAVLHVLSREAQDVDLLNGRITREKCDALFTHWVRVADVDAAFLCGPQEMMRAAAASLEAHGLDRRQIKFELFGAGSRAQAARPAPDAGENLCHVSVTQDGRTQSFDFTRGSMSLLDAGLAHGLELPFACKAGVCSTCKATLVEGEVDMDANQSLEDYEVARGLVLMCQSFPVTAKVAVDYDR